MELYKLNITQSAAVVVEAEHAFEFIFVYIESLKLDFGTLKLYKFWHVLCVPPK